jgi:hypothetical protein
MESAGRFLFGILALGYDLALIYELASITSVQLPGYLIRVAIGIFLTIGAVYPYIRGKTN